MFDVHPRAGGSRHRHHPRPDDAPWTRGSFREIVHALRAGGPGVRRGDIRPLILRALQREPMHGYQVIQELEAMSGGRWRPSAGSVYPTLQQLEDEGLVRAADVDGRRVYSLTDEGKTAASQAADPLAGWFGQGRGGRDRDSGDIRRLAMQLAGAVMQVSRAGSPSAQREAREVLVDARRRMYRILADDLDVAPDANEGGAANASSTSTAPE